METILATDQVSEIGSVVQSAEIAITGATSYIIDTKKSDDITIKLPEGKTIQYDENSWLLFNASLKALTTIELERLLDGKLDDLNTGIYQYINQVSTLKEQAVTEARALVAKLETDTGTSLSTLLRYNNVRATETATNAVNITGLNSAITHPTNGLTAHSSAIQTLNTEVGIESGGLKQALVDANISIATLRSQVDSKIEFFFTETEFEEDGITSLAPSLNANTSPDAPWDTIAKKQLHNDDIWYIKGIKKANRYSSATNAWYEDKALSNLHLDVLAAQQTADNKANIWYGTKAISNGWTDVDKSNNIGDMLVEEIIDANNIVSLRTYRWNGINWIDISDSRISANATAITEIISTIEDEDNGLGAHATAISILNTEVGIVTGGLKQRIANLEAQIDGVVETWADTHNVLDLAGKPDITQYPYKTWYDLDIANSSTQERSKHTGDTYIKYSISGDTKTYIDSYRFFKGDVSTTTDAQGYGWFKIVDQTAIDALEKALEAGDLADKKRRVFTNTPYAPYDIGDLFVDGSHIYKCIVSKPVLGTYVDTDFDRATDYTNDDTINTFVNVTFDAYKTSIKDQLDHVKQFYFTESLVDESDNSLAPSVTEDWSEAQRIVHNKDVWYVSGTRQAFIYDYITNTWYEDPLTVDLAAEILKAQQTGDKKANIWYGTKTISDLWTASEKEININDLLVEETTIAGKTNRTTYRWNGSQWLDISDTRISKLEEDVGSIEAQTDHAIDIIITLQDAIDPAIAWTTQEVKNSHHGDIWATKTALGGIANVKFYNARTGTWLTNKPLETSMIDTIKAQVTADSKSHIFYMSLEDAQAMSTTWTASEKFINIGDALTVNNGNVSYRWDGSQWQPIDDSRLQAHTEAIEKISAVLTTQGATYNGNTTVLNDISLEISNNIPVLKSKYGVTTELGTDGNMYVTGFGLNSEVTYNTDGSTSKVSDFNVAADSFSLTHPATLNKVKMNQNGLYFQKPDGSTAKYLQFIHTYNNVENNLPITLSGVTRVPNILMGINTMPTYLASKKDQDQSFTFEITNASGTTPDANGVFDYTFTPKALLHLSASVFNDILTGNFSNSPTNIKYSDNYRATTLINPVQISYNIGSVLGTSIAGIMQKRKCTITMQKSLNASSWTDLGSTISYFGDSVTAQAGSITYSSDIAENTYLRLKFEFSNDSGTFGSSVAYWSAPVSAELTKALQFAIGNFVMPTLGCGSSNTGHLGSCSSWLNTTIGAVCRYGYCGTSGSYPWSYIISSVSTKYRSNEGYSANEVLTTMLPGYTLVSVDYEASEKSVSTLQIHNYWTQWYSASSELRTTNLGTDKPYLCQDDGTNTSFNRSSFSGTIKTKITAKLWVVPSGDTTIKNTVTDLALHATAKAQVLLATALHDTAKAQAPLATGTMNIIVVE